MDFDTPVPTLQFHFQMLTNGLRLALPKVSSHPWSDRSQPEQQQKMKIHSHSTAGKKKELKK
jgi:hypothetical protein